jgi:hypothetical protein
LAVGARGDRSALRQIGADPALRRRGRGHHGLTLEATDNDAASTVLTPDGALSRAVLTPYGRRVDGAAIAY